MSRVYTCDFTTPQKMLSIADNLRKLKIDNVRMHLQFVNSADLDIYKSIKFFKQQEHPVVESEPSDQEENKSEKAESSDYYSSDDEDNPKKFAQVKQEKSYQFELESPARYVFKDVYANQLSQLEKTFACKVEVTKDYCKIQGKNVDKGEIKTRLRAMVSNIRTAKVKQSIRFGVQKSEYIKEKLALKNIFIGIAPHFRFFWAKKQDINEQDFNQIITKLESSHRIVMPFWEPKKQKLKFKSPRNQYIWLFYLLSNTLEPKRKQLEKIYEIKIEVSPNMKGFIIHAAYPELGNIIIEQFKKLLQNLFVFSLSVCSPIPKEKQDQIKNYVKRFCKKSVQIYLEPKKIAFSMPINKINRKLPTVIKLLSTIGLQYERKTMLVAIMCHFREPSLLKQFLDRYDLSAFRNIHKSSIGNLKFSQPKLESEICSKIMETLNNFAQFIIARSNGELPPIPEQKSEISEKPNISSTEHSLDELSRSMINEESKQEESFIEKKISYDLVVPYEPQFEKLEEGVHFRIGKKDKIMEKQVMEKFGLQIVCRLIVYNQKFELPNLQGKTQVYATNQDFMDNQNLKKTIKVFQLNPKNNNYKYLVQVDIKYLQKVPGKTQEFSISNEFYIPTHEVIRI